MNTIIEDIKNKNNRGFFLIAGPCVVENEEMPMAIAHQIKEITDEFNIPFIFKASYRKANRTKLDSFTGIGDRRALETINEVGRTLDIPVITDVHTEDEARLAAGYVDILQIPAFLCRQTGLLLAAASTGKAVNVKKGQFVSAESMHYAIDKIRSCNSKGLVMLTERGTTFGYQDLIVDFRNIPIMQSHGVPVILDITHSLQQPNQPGGVSGGNPGMISTIARAGIAAGTDGIFLETHPAPEKAKSDGANMLRLDLLKDLLSILVKINNAVC